MAITASETLKALALAFNHRKHHNQTNQNSCRTKFSSHSPVLRISPRHRQLLSDFHQATPASTKPRIKNFTQPTGSEHQVAVPSSSRPTNTATGGHAEKLVTVFQN